MNWDTVTQSTYRYVNTGCWQRSCQPSGIERTGETLALFICSH